MQGAGPTPRVAIAHSASGRVGLALEERVRLFAAHAQVEASFALLTCFGELAAMHLRL